MITVFKEAEIKLVDAAGGISGETQSWRAVYFHFDKLLEQYRSEYQIQIAVNLLGDLLFANQGGVYVCHDSSIILLCRAISRSQIEKAIFQLRYLFMDDPLSYDNVGDENHSFCKIYDLGTEYAEFYHLCRQKLSQAARIEKTAAEPAKTFTTSAGTPEIVADSGNHYFTPRRLANIEHDLNKADLSRMLRRQPICAITGNNNIRKVFDEYYIHIAHLRQMLQAKMDFFSNRWLFKYLTQILDERMLDMLMMSPMRYFENPVSLNFNVETILSQKFLDFDAVMKSMVKVSILIEIQIGDIFGDISGFVAAKNLLQKLGYKICIDGLTNLSIIHIDREKLGFDLAKLQWNADLEDDLGAEENKALMSTIKYFGPNRVILCRCDTRQAVNYGQAMGISIFQGRYIDRMLNPNEKVDN